MSDEEEVEVEEKPFAIERAKQGRAVCKKCKQKCLQGELRLAKLVYNPFGGGKMKAWHHIECLFEAFLKQRKTTKRIDSPDEIDGWDDLEEDEQDDIVDRIKDCNKFFGVTSTTSTTGNNKKKKDPVESKKEPVKDKAGKTNKDKAEKTNKDKEDNKDDTNKLKKNKSFKEFRKLVADITNTDSYLDKTRCVQETFANIFPDSSDKDDIILWCRLLLPGVVKRVYNLQSKQLIKLFSRLFVTDQNEMLDHLEKGDIGETIQTFFEDSVKMKPAKKCILTVVEVDKFLDQLSELTKEEDQLDHFKSLVPKCTSNDLKMVIRLIKGDLRMGAGAKHILDAVHANAYENYQTSRDLDTVITKCLSGTITASSTKSVKGNVVLLTPVLPMLAESCKSVEQAMKKCPNGMYSEIKYDGERVQIHKCGPEFKYFSRSLKPVLPHKIQHFKEYITKAFPRADDIILDSEILMVDTTTGKPLPFGTLGKYKKTEFKDATVCLFVFDCIYFNGESLIKRPLSERKQFLRDNMTEIPNHIMFSELEEIHKKEDLSKMIAKVLKMGLEGLVLKDIKSIYEPGKRHWLKVKKDYLFDGAMADSADLIVLGAWYGTGKKGGMMSVFLMGCYDSKNDKFCTVTKVHTGHDDKTLEKLQSELDMIKIKQEQSKLPNWLKCTKTMIPDFVAKDPKKQPVWEITGAEFTKHDVHTADGISIRFPRVTKIRDDKNWKTATNLKELNQLYTNSKENPDISMLVKGLDSSSSQTSSDVKLKRKLEEDTDSDDKTNKTPPKRKKVTNRTKIEKEEEEEESTSKIEEESTGSKVEDISDDKELFAGIKVVLADELKNGDHKDIIKKFTKNGGTVLSEDDSEQATYALHYYNVIREPLLKCSFTIRHLSFEWVEDCIKEGNVLDYKSYTVQWNPDV